MSTRLGMGEGRCLTSYLANKQSNDVIMARNGIQFEDNYRYRQFLQNGGIQALNMPFRNGACGAPVPMGTAALKNGNLNLN